MGGGVYAARVCSLCIGGGIFYLGVESVFLLSIPADVALYSPFLAVLPTYGCTVVAQRNRRQRSRPAHAGLRGYRGTLSGSTKLGRFKEEDQEGSG